MSNDTRPTTDQHRRQIEAYGKEHRIYERFAAALERVLREACERAVPEAVIQARAKTLSSFAEKCVRKWEKYKNPSRQLTDLCGARVIVHTLEQVRAVRAFVEQNFTVVECDDKSAALAEDKFGYRDTHYLVKLKADRATEIGFTANECKVIGQRVAELQVRTLVQHAWADIMHDRLYKAPLKLGRESKRTGALLAAIMEDGDRTFDRLAGELDGMAANYTAYASRKDVEAEIGVQELIMKNTPDRKARVPVALKLAQLLAPLGEYARIAEMLEPFQNIGTTMRDDVLLELGHALCRVHRAKPQSPAYVRGRDFVAAVAANCARTECPAVPNLRKKRSMLARALSRLAWIEEARDDSQHEARNLYRRALETEPSNPYHLANQLAFEVYCASGGSILESMATQIHAGIATCREHAVAGTELPFAHFTAGRLCLLLGEADEALGWVARGLRHLFDEQSCVSEAVLDDEVAWIGRIHFGEQAPPALGWVKRLIALARHFAAVRRAGKVSAGAAEDRVLIVAGGAVSLDRATLRRIRPLVERVLAKFSGTVISGGTRVGVPGCVGGVAAKLRGRRRNFELVGYIPRSLPKDAPLDSRYDRHVETDDDHFSSGQIIRMWEDMRERDITPERVQLIGFGGGLLTAVEFRVALALGASTAAVHCTGGAADAMLNDPVWRGTKTLLGMPLDPTSAQAFVTVPEQAYTPGRLAKMAQSFHAHYVEDNPKKLPENLRPWDKLPDTFRTANLEQARYAVEILRAAGFEVRPKSRKAGAIQSFAGRQWKRAIERMAELEHGRWNVERLRDGWRFGRPRDDARKLHDCLVPWENLPENIREYDRNSIRAFPKILSEAGLEVFRRPGVPASSKTG